MIDGAGYRLLSVSENDINAAKPHSSMKPTNSIQQADCIKYILFFTLLSGIILVLSQLTAPDSLHSSTSSQAHKAYLQPSQELHQHNQKQAKSSSSSDKNSHQESRTTVLNLESTYYREYLSNSRDSWAEKLTTNHQADDLITPSAANGLTSIWWSYEFRNNSNYVAITNYVRATKSFSYNSSITLTTQATLEFMYHALELCKRWDGPISLAVFCPGQELISAVSLIKYMRECLPQPLSTCVKDKITWHIVYNVGHGPSVSNLNFPSFYLAQNNESLFTNQHICPKLPGPYPETSIRQFEQKLRQRLVDKNETYRKLLKLTYPINVLRNTARLAAKTKYILASDIELYPSVNLVPHFIRYVTNNNIKEEYSHMRKYVFTLPIFEVESNVSPPRTKSELKQLFQKGKAIYFHKWVCDICQKFPNRQRWFDSDDQSTDSAPGQDEPDDKFEVFKVTQRSKSLNSWEPIYIGTNDEPLYDERLSWEGRRDKMSQAYQLCLENYYLLILKNAFLVHAPGIKHIDNNDISGRIDHLRQNNKVYDNIITDLKRQYESKSTISTC